MLQDKSYHSICRWTFNAGKGGFVPSDIRPDWSSDNLDTVGTIRLIRERIVPRMPERVVLGFELHYDTEVNDRDAADIADALTGSDLYLAMITPGAHSHWAYGGIASLDPREREQVEEYGRRTVDIGYGPLRKAWHPEAALAPSFVLWNGSFGYDLASIGIRKMYQNLKESVARLCEYEAKKGGSFYIGFEPKPNEGHPAMLIPTVASAILFWKRLAEEFGISPERKGVNKEFGHSEMIGLDPVYDTVEELDNQAMIHMHLNSQGYSDGIILGGPGKFDIDHGARVNGLNVAMAGLIADAGYSRWKGHDMQARSYDDTEQAIDRVIRSILSWEACEMAADELDAALLMRHLAARETAKAEDLIRGAVVSAYTYFDRMYRA